MGNKLQLVLQNKRWQLFLVFWVINVVFSIIYKFCYYHTGQHLKYTWVPDMLFFLLLILAIPRKENGLVLMGILFLLLFKIIGSWSIASSYPNTIDLYKDVVKTWMGYVYVLLLFLFLSPTSNQIPVVIPKYVKQAFVVLAGGFALSVFVGLVLRTYVFNTYTGTNRFGISGFLYPFSYVSYFYMLSITSVYLLHKRMPSNKVYSILLYILSLAAIFSGTKSTYLFLIVFYAVFVIDKQYYRKKWLWLTLSGVLLLLVFFREKLASTFSLLVELYQKEDFLTFALSYRNVYARSTWLFVQEDWTLVNYLFGGLDNVNQLTEMAFIDLFLNFGIIGTGLFLYFYYRVILRFLQASPVNITIAVGILLLIALGGNFFDRVYLAYWLVFLFLLLKRNNNPQDLESF